MGAVNVNEAYSESKLHQSVVILVAYLASTMFNCFLKEAKRFGVYICDATGLLGPTGVTSISRVELFLGTSYASLMGVLLACNHK
jgi:hypothetical protein